MKPFKLIISVDKDGKNTLTIDGSGKKEVTEGQIITYLAGELEKLELDIAINNIGKKVFELVKQQAQGIQLIKDLPPSMKNKQ